MSTTRLVILGLLRRQPLHGYEIKHMIEEEMSDWTSIAFGSIYFALGKLQEEGMIDKVATEQQGNRPSRSVYEITQSGREEFLQLLRGLWTDMERTYFPLDIGIFYLDALPIEEIKGYLKKRIAILEAILVHLDEHQQEELAREEVPEIAGMIFEHTVVHTQAELGWMRKLLEKVEKGAT